MTQFKEGDRVDLIMNNEDQLKLLADLQKLEVALSVYATESGSVESIRGLLHSIGDLLGWSAATVLDFIQKRDTAPPLSLAAAMVHWSENVDHDPPIRDAYPSMWQKFGLSLDD